MRLESVREEMKHEHEEDGKEGKVKGTKGFSRRRSTRFVLGEVIGKVVY